MGELGHLELTVVLAVGNHFILVTEMSFGCSLLTRPPGLGRR